MKHFISWKACLKTWVVLLYSPILQHTAVKNQRQFIKQIIIKNTNTISIKGGVKNKCKLVNFPVYSPGLWSAQYNVWVTGFAVLQYRVKRYMLLLTCGKSVLSTLNTVVQRHNLNLLGSNVTVLAGLLIKAAVTFVAQYKS